MGGEHSRKEPFDQLVHSYLEHLNMSAPPVVNARDDMLRELTQLINDWLVVCVGGEGCGSAAGVPGLLQ